MNNKNLDKKIKKARESFSLPPEVSSTKIQLSNGRFDYVFRHTTYGELGRLLIIPHSNRESQFVVEVSGDPDDPMTIKRQEILGPIASEMLKTMAMICGNGKGTPEPYQIPEQKYEVRCEEIPCKACSKLVALLVLSEADTVAGLEDYARMMHATVKEKNVPTWVIGREREVKINSGYAGLALSMKLWPERGNVQEVLSTEFNPLLDQRSLWLKSNFFLSYSCRHSGCSYTQPKGRLGLFLKKNWDSYEKNRKTSYKSIAPWWSNGSKFI
jgi:hypothetical protein